MNQRIQIGDIVRHFKYETLRKELKETNTYLYKVLNFAKHTETGDELVIYQALYTPFAVYARPYDMFMGKVDKNKYPDIKQEYRLETVNDPEEVLKISETFKNMLISEVI